MSSISWLTIIAPTYMRLIPNCGGGGSCGVSANENRGRIYKCLKRPGIYSDDLISLTYVAWRAGTTNRVVVPACQAGNRFLGSQKGLQIRAQLYTGALINGDLWL